MALVGPNVNLSSLLLERAARGRSVYVSLIGAGQFGSMILSQAERAEG